jgi:hypothetical protein
MDERREKSNDIAPVEFARLSKSRPEFSLLLVETGDSLFERHAQGPIAPPRGDS